MIANDGTSIFQHGQKYPLVDFEIGEILIITDQGAPLFGADFFTYFDFSVDLKRRKSMKCENKKISRTLFFDLIFCHICISKFL